jgi:hypothetical protein
VNDPKYHFRGKDLGPADVDALIETNAYPAQSDDMLKWLKGEGLLYILGRDSPTKKSL